MKIKKLLKKFVEEKLIDSIDFNFAMFVSNNQESILMLASACVHYITRIGGHTCVPLNKNKEFLYSTNNKLINIFWKYININTIDILLKYNSVGNGKLITPIVIFNNSLYLYNNWTAEQSIFKFFNENILSKKINTQKASRVLKSLFNKQSQKLQKIAIATAILCKNSFIIGGPGTGKTTIIFKLILSFIHLSHRPLKIKLAAPTGKAAIRLIECLKNNFNKFKINTIEKKLFPIKAVTLHHLLKINPSFEKNYSRKKFFLNLDILIIDESSMIDIYIMHQLIKELPQHTKLILVGDMHQLPSIKSGSILKDICQLYNNTYSLEFYKSLKSITQCHQLTLRKKKSFTVTDSICFLKKNYRFSNKSDIHKLSQSILNYNKNNFKTLFKNYHQNIKFIEINNTLLYRKMIKKMVSNYTNYWNEIKNNESFTKIIKTFNKYRILCAIKKGIFGIRQINKNIEYEMKNLGLIHKIENLKKFLYVGKPIIIKKSDKNLNILNGDIGILMHDDKQILKAFFLLSNNSIISIPINLITYYETAWSMTIHKSQGSEFERISIVLPNKYYSLLTKELIYTAVTRAKEKITIYSSKEIFVKATSKCVFRSSNLSNLINVT